MKPLILKTISSIKKSLKRYNQNNHQKISITLYRNPHNTFLGLSIHLGPSYSKLYNYKPENIIFISSFRTDIDYNDSIPSFKRLKEFEESFKNNTFDLDKFRKEYQSNV